MMNKVITLLVFFSLIFSSCKKENEDYFVDENANPNIEIDSLKYSYITNKNDYYYEGLFKGKEDIRKFNLKLKENRKYRISSSQKYNDISAISLSLLQGSDTVTLSQVLNQQNVLYFNSSKEQTFTLQAQLKEEINISLDFRLYFEELEYDSLNLSTNLFTYHGHFSDEVTDSIYFYPSNSNWYKWLKLEQNISNTSSISYDIISSEENQNYEFGFVIGGSEELSTENQFQNNLPNGLFFSIHNNQYSVTKIETAYSSVLETGNLPNSLDLTQKIHIEIVTDPSYYNKKKIFINNELVAFVNSPEMNYFYNVFSDKNQKEIKIFNFEISE